MTIKKKTLSHPKRIAAMSRQFASPLFVIAWLLLLTSWIWGLVFAPADYQQRDAFRIIYVHVPCAAMSMLVYSTMAIAASIYYIGENPLAAYCCRVLAPLGGLFTILALATGALWGKPMWGPFWSWSDPRLMSELILFFLYLGYIALNKAIEDETTADKIGAILLVVGVINIPIIHYSVVWWHSLHQGATLFQLAKPSMPADMLWPLLVALLGASLYVIAYALTGIRCQIIEAYNQRLTINIHHD